MTEIRSVVEGKKRYLDLLLLGDEQEEMIDRYLECAEMYIGLDGARAVAVCVVTDEGNGVLEIRNLAVAPDRQRRGVGRAMIEHIVCAYRERFHTLRAGTGDSPLTLPFYEACGFCAAGRIENFFTENYDHPIVEGGVLLRDMVILERSMA